MGLRVYSLWFGVSLEGLRFGALCFRGCMLEGSSFVFVEVLLQGLHLGCREVKPLKERLQHQKWSGFLQFKSRGLENRLRPGLR